MKKTNLIILFFCLLVSTIHAQITSTSNSEPKKNFSFALSPSLNIATGMLGDFNSLGVGLEAMGLVKVGKNAQFFGQLGYQSFIGDTYSSSIIDASNIPESFNIDDYTYSTKFPNISNVTFLIGARTNINKLILGTGLGLGYYSVAGFSQSGFAISPQVGYATKKVDLLFHYTNSFVNLGSLGNTGIKAYFKF